MKFLLGLWRQARQHNESVAPDAPHYSLTIERVNGLSAVVGWLGTNLETVFTFVESENDGIVAIDVVRNPDKLAYLKRELAAIR